MLVFTLRQVCWRNLPVLSDAIRFDLTNSHAQRSILAANSRFQSGWRSVWLSKPRFRSAADSSRCSDPQTCFWIPPGRSSELGLFSRLTRVSPKVLWCVRPEFCRSIRSLRFSIWVNRFRWWSNGQARLFRWKFGRCLLLVSWSIARFKFDC